MADPTAASCAAWGRFPLPEVDTDERDQLDQLVDAVLSWCRDHYTVATPATDVQAVAVQMIVARLWRRRDTPEGVAAFADVAAIRVTAMDADVERLLSPQYGIA